MTALKQWKDIERMRKAAPDLLEACEMALRSCFKAEGMDKLEQQYLVSAINKARGTP